MAHVLAEDLRAAVLQAAIQGKLTDQLPEDGNARSLLPKIKKEKERLLAHKGMKDREKLPSINEMEPSFEIKDNWCWIQMNDIGVFKKGPFGSALTKSIFVPKSENTIKVYEQKNAIQKDHTLGNYYISSDYYADKMTGFTVESGDIIVSCAGTIGETFVMPSNIELGIINQALMRMTIASNINTEYFLLVFDCALKEEAKKNSAGSAIKNIPPFKVFKAMLFPLPPLAEQKRIVARVKELMAKIDEYEKLEKQLVELKAKFPEDMKAALLQAAMEGKLTERLPEDGDAVLLRNDILLQRKAVGKLPKMQQLEVDASFPDEWSYARVGEVLGLLKGQKVNEVYLPYLEAAFIRGKSEPKYKSSGEYVKQGTKVILVDGENSGEVFEEPVDGIMGSTFKVLFIPEAINTKYANYYLAMNRSRLRSNKKGAAIPHLNKDLFYNLVIPIPSIEEQKRIVEKLDQLLPLCDELAELNE